MTINKAKVTSHIQAIYRAADLPNPKIIYLANPSIMLCVYVAASVLSYGSNANSVLLSIDEQQEAHEKERIYLLRKELVKTFCSTKERLFESRSMDDYREARTLIEYFINQKYKVDFDFAGCIESEVPSNFRYWVGLNVSVSDSLFERSYKKQYYKINDSGILNQPELNLSSSSYACACMLYAHAKRCNLNLDFIPIWHFLTQDRSKFTLLNDASIYAAYQYISDWIFETGHLLLDGTGFAAVEHPGGEYRRLWMTLDDHEEFSSHSFDITNSSWFYHWDSLSKACFGAFLDEQFCLVCDFPETITKNDEVFHNESGPACAWNNGPKLYFWHGVEVPEHWILSRDTLSPAEVLSTNNVEQRAAGAEIIGWEKIEAELGAKIIDDSGSEDIGQLIELTLPGLDDPERFLKAWCPRNGWIYEAVPAFSDVDDLPIKTALHAQAWRVGETQADYVHPITRT